MNLDFQNSRTVDIQNRKKKKKSFRNFEKLIQNSVSAIFSSDTKVGRKMIFLLDF